MLAFRSLDPFRALREPDRRRRDEERLSRSEQRTLSKTQNNHLTGKAPYKFESALLQRRVSCEPGFLRRGVVTPRSPTITTRCSLKRCFSLSICAASVTGSAVLPSNTSTATGQPSAAHIRPMTICGRSQRWSRL